MYIAFEEPPLLDGGKEACPEWITALYRMGEKLTITAHAGWYSPETTNFSLKRKSADSTHEFTRTSRDVRQISAATEAWRPLLRLLRYEPRGHLTWWGCLNPVLTFAEHLLCHVQLLAQLSYTKGFCTVAISLLPRSCWSSRTLFTPT